MIQRKGVLGVDRGQHLHRPIGEGDVLHECCHEIALHVTGHHGRARCRPGTDAAGWEEMEPHHHPLDPGQREVQG